MSHLHRDVELSEIKRIAIVLAPPAIGSVLSLLASQLSNGPRYTVSLSCFLLPSILMLWQLRRLRRDSFAHDVRSLAWLLVMVVPLAWTINLALADTFFRYTNDAAILGIRTPSMTRGRFAIRYLVPIEEYAFYVFGFLYMALLYLLARSVLKKQYPLGVAHLPWTHRPASGAQRYLAFLPSLLVLGLWFYVRLSGWPGGFPAYLAYVLLLPTTCLLIVWNKVLVIVHRAALGYAVAVTVLVSIIWEGVLAVPDQWWGYNERVMLGVYVSSGLPIEAVLVWFMGPLTTVAALVSVESIFQGQSLLDQ